MTAVRDGPTSIRVSWTPPSPLEDTSTSGYRIYYTRAGGSSDSEDIDGGNTNTHTLMGLTNGETYTISIVGRSSTSSTVLPSPPLSAEDVALGIANQYEIITIMLLSLSVPSAPVLDGPPIVTATTIRITGSVPGSVVTRFEVEWQRHTSVGCSNVNERTISVNGAFTSHTITGLEPGNSYTITVTVSNSAGTAPDSSPVTAMTPETGERERVPDTQFKSWFVLSSTAPTGAPDGVSEGLVTANSITVQWGEVPCMDRNGEITGYTVEVTLSGMVVETENVNGGSAREATVSGLTPSTQYTVTVVAINSVGSGPFSGISITTAG